MKLTQDFTPKIPVVIELSACPKHDAQMGEPCFSIRAKESIEKLRAVCHTRALKVGFNGRISDEAIRNRKTPRS